MSKPHARPTLGVRRASLEALGAKPTSSIPESTLIYGYRKIPKNPGRIAPEPTGGPLAPVVDENGFLHGEPVSEGRTARKET